MVVSLMLAVTLVPLANAPSVIGTGDDVVSVTGEQREVDEADLPYLKDNGDGTYTFHFPYLEEKLGIKARDVVYGDPSHGAIDIRPMELHYYDGGDVNKMYKPTEGSGSSLGEYEIPNGTVMSKGIARGVEFGMLLKGNDDGHEDLVNYGININGVFFLQMAGAEGKITFDSSQSEYMTYAVNNYSCVSPMQSVNLLPYTVGNFTEDDSEEIALFMGDCIYLCDYADGSIVHYDTIYLEKNTSTTVDPYGHGPMFNPVSMTAGDTDGDGLDEILVSVEYSETHASPYECCMGSHMTVLSLMDPTPVKDPDGDLPDPVRTSRVYMDYVNEAVGMTEHLDSVMTSVCLDDIDLDGDFEIVIGGYMWDNGNHAFDITLDKLYYTGELYLGLLSPDAIADGSCVTPQYLVRPMDDDGTASNGIDPENKYDDRDEYDHYPKDTSIFTEDGAENDFGYCRSNNWMNWTIPLTVLDMRGNGNTNVVYFDYGLFDVTMKGFSFLKNLEPPYVQDNNNCCLISLDAAYVHPRQGDSCLGYQDLFRFMALDTKGNGDVLWHADLNYMVDEAVYRQELASYVYYAWEEPQSDAPMCCLVDWDASDTIRAKYIGSVSTITDPVVLAAVSAIPYDEDLAFLLEHGNNDVGSTSFLMHSGSETTSESSFSTSYEMGGSLDTMFMNASASGGWFGEIGSSHTQSVDLDVEFDTSTDSVVLYFTPYFSYTYATFMGNNGNPTMEIQTITEFQNPLTVILDKDNYREFILDYNALMIEYTEAQEALGQITDPDYHVEFVSLPVIEPFNDHVEGDVSSYLETPDDVLTVPQSFVYFGTADSGSMTKSVMLSQSDSDTSTAGGMMNAEVSSGCVVFFDFGMGFESSSSTTTTDNSGLGFSAEFNDGLQSAYYRGPSYAEEAEEILSQYSVSGEYWATKMTTDNQSYIYVGYTTNGGYNSGAKLGEVVPDTADQDGTDKDDPMNPGYGRTYMDIVIPGNFREDQEAMYYTLDICFQDKWYDVGSTVWNLGGKDFELGLNEVVFDDQGNVVTHEITYEERGKTFVETVPVVKETGDVYTGDALYVPDKVFVPVKDKDRTITVEVSNLQNITKYNGQLSFEFRLIGYSYRELTEPAGGFDSNPYPWTASKPTTGYTALPNADNIVTGCDYQIRDGTLHLFPDELVDGSNVILRSVDLSPGTTLDVTVYDPNSDREFLFSHITVGSNGFIMIDLEYDAPRDAPLAVTVFTFLGILVCLGAGWYILRRN